MKTKNSSRLLSLKKHINRLIVKKFVFIACLFLCGCFAYITVRNGDNPKPDIRQDLTKEPAEYEPRPIVKESDDRVRFLELGATIIASECMLDNTLVEIYQMPKEKEEVVKTFADGVIDIKTAFDLDFQDTTLSSCLELADIMLVKVVYGPNSGIISIEIIQ